MIPAGTIIVFTSDPYNYKSVIVWKYAATALTCWEDEIISQLSVGDVLLSLGLSKCRIGCEYDVFLWNSIVVEISLLEWALKMCIVLPPRQEGR